MARDSPGDEVVDCGSVAHVEPDGLGGRPGTYVDVTPRRDDVFVDNLPANLPALRFAEAARTLGAAARAAGLEVPAFRCPPRIAGATRTIRRYPGGTVVSVRLLGRPFEHALADMVEGVLVANRVDAPAQPDLRALLHEALTPEPPEHGVAQAA